MTVRKLTEQELEALRSDMRDASAWMKATLAKRRTPNAGPDPKIAHAQKAQPPLLG